MAGPIARMTRTLRRVALLAAALLSPVAQSPSAQERIPSGAPIRGVRGEPVARAVVQWIDIVRQGSERAPTRSAKKSDPSRRITHDLRLPDGALVRVEEPAVAAPAAAVTLPPSPAPASDFEALPNSPNEEPPDTHGAVGRNHLMVTLNSEVRIQDRSGRSLSTVTLDAFWSRVSGGGPFDPRVLYDPYADRWITTAVGNFYRSLLVGVSRSADPMGGWNLYRIDPGSGTLVDFPTVGFNKDWVVVTGFQVWVFEKANLYRGGSGSFTSIPLEPGIWGYPAQTLDPAASALYLAQVWNGNDDGNGVLRLHKITGPIGSEVLTPGAFVATPNPWSSAFPETELCPQMGTPRRISCFGGTETVYRNGAIWVVHEIFLPAEAPTRTAIQWWQLTPDGGVVQRGRLEDPSGVRFYGFPSIAVNANGDMLLGFSSFSGQQFASASYAYRAAGDPPGTLREERVFKAGEDSYVRDEADHANRWGDYSASAVDPVNDTDLWTIQEYAMTRDPTNPTRDGASVASRWGTWWARVVPEAAPAERPPPRPATRSRTPRELPPRGR